MPRGPIKTPFGDIPVFSNPEVRNFVDSNIGKAAGTLHPNAPFGVPRKNLLESGFLPAIPVDDPLDLYDFFTPSMGMDPDPRYFSQFNPGETHSFHTKSAVEMASAGNWDLYNTNIAVTESARKAQLNAKTRVARARAANYWSQIDPRSFSEEFMRRELGLVKGPLGKRWGEIYFGTNENEWQEYLRAQQAEASAVPEVIDTDASDYYPKMDDDPYYDLYKKRSSKKRAIEESGGNPLNIVDPYEEVLNKKVAGMGGERFRAVHEDFISTRLAEYESGARLPISGDRVMTYGPRVNDWGLVLKPGEKASARFIGPVNEFEMLRKMTGQYFKISPLDTTTHFEEFGGGASAWGLRDAIDINEVKIVGKVKEAQIYPELEAMVQEASQATNPRAFNTAIKRIVKRNKSIGGMNFRTFTFNQMMEEFYLRWKVAGKIARSKHKAATRMALMDELKNTILPRATEFFRKEGSAMEMFESPLSGGALIDYMRGSDLGAGTVISGVSSGDILVGSEGEKYLVSQTEDLSDIVLRQRGGGSIIASELSNKYLDTARSLSDSYGGKSRFEVMAVREPGKYFGKEMNKAIRIYSSSGEYLGLMNEAAAEKFMIGQAGQANIESGYIGTLFGEFEKRKTSPLSGGEEYISANLFASETDRAPFAFVEGSYKAPSGEVLRGPDYDVVQDKWKKMYKNKALSRVDDAARDTMKAFHPTQQKTVMIDFSESASRAVTKGTKEGIGRKGLIVASSIAAGALLLWGANKALNRRSPIRSDDVPMTPYGNPDMYEGSSGQAQYRPKTRITPNNSGYISNVDMEMSDSSEQTDYRALASQMSNISKMYFDRGNVVSSIHVVDDSSKISRESIRRHINQQIRI